MGPLSFVPAEGRRGELLGLAGAKNKRSGCGYASVSERTERLPSSPLSCAAIRVPYTLSVGRACHHCGDIPRSKGVP